MINLISTFIKIILCIFKSKRFLICEIALLKKEIEILKTKARVSFITVTEIIVKGKAKFEINNLSINTGNQEFGTVYFKDKIVFTSTGTDSKFIKRVWNINELPFLDLYISDQDKSELINVRPFNKSIHSPRRWMTPAIPPVAVTVLRPSHPTGRS